MCSLLKANQDRRLGFGRVCARVTVNFQRREADDLTTGGKFGLQRLPFFRQCLIRSDVYMLHISPQLEVQWLQLIGNCGVLSALDLDTDKHPLVSHVDPMVYSHCLNLGILDRLPHFVHQSQTNFAVTLVFYYGPFATQLESDWFVGDDDFHCAALCVIHGYDCYFFLRFPRFAAALAVSCLTRSFTMRSIRS